MLFTRTSSAIRARTLQHLQDAFVQYGVTGFATQMHEREAFHAIFSFGGTLDTLDPKQVSNRATATATANARAFATEVVGMLRIAAKPQPAEAAQ